MPPCQSLTAITVELGGTERGASVLEGLDFMHAREYDWRIARFTAPDPVRDGWNPYAYVSGNPVNFVDLWGLAGVEGLGGQDLPVNLSLSGPIDVGFGGEIEVVAEDPGFGGEIEVAGGWTQEQAFMYLEGMKYNAWLRSQRSVNLFAPVEGGIMTRLAEQPRVHTGADVLQTMASYECHATWEDVWKNMAVTNSFGLKGPGGFTLLSARKAGVFGANLVAGTSVPAELGLPTLWEVGRSGFRGMVIDGVTVSSGEAALVASGASFAEFGLTYPAWQAGVFAGSVLNVMFTAPCSWGG